MNDQYTQLYRSYQWLVPSQFNIAQACAHRWAENPLEGRHIAIYHESETGLRQVWTYSRLSQTTNQLANGLLKMNVRTGDRVALIMGQRPEAVAAYMAIFSVGAIAVPLSPGLNADDLAMRLCDADARVAIIDALGGKSWLAVATRCPALTQIVALEFQHEAVMGWHGLLTRQPSTFKIPATPSSNAAMLLYPAGLTQAPKAALLSHGALIGSLPGFVASQNWFPQKADVFWSASDWSSATGLLAGLLPTLYFGRAIVGSTGSLPATRIFELLARYAVTNILMPSSTINDLTAQIAAPLDHYPLALRALASTGPTMGKDTFDWCQNVLGVVPNEVFGQTEISYAIGNSHNKWPVKPGSIGRPYPGHQVAVLDTDGKPLPVNTVGKIAVNRRDIQGHLDPALFLGYWRNETATAAKFTGPSHEWYLTGERGRVDNDGYFWLVDEGQAPDC